MLRSISYFSLLLPFCLILACGNQENTTPPDLEGTSWQLINMPGGLPATLDINLQFEADRISGKGVCNRYFSAYELDGNQINFKAVGATEMMCIEHSDLEAKYFQLLGKAKTLQSTGNQLTINTADGDLVYQTAAAPTAE